MALSPTSSRGSSGASAPLTLTGLVDEVQLAVLGKLDQNANVLTVENGNTGASFTVDAYGNVAASSTASFGGPGAGNARRLTVDGQGNTSQDVVQVKNKDGTASAGVNVDGALWTSLTSAPPDASFFASRLMFWFDNTNGAAKLMVKAKDASGAFVTAAIALA